MVATGCGWIWCVLVWGGVVAMDACYGVWGMDAMVVSYGGVCCWCVAYVRGCCRVCTALVMTVLLFVKWDLGAGQVIGPYVSIF